MMPILCRIALLIFLGFCGAHGRLYTADAQPLELKTIATKHVEDGLAAQTAGRYEEAIASYNKAYELVPHPVLLFNLGQAYRLKGDKAIALSYYLKYLAIDTSGPGAAQAAEWSSQLERELRAEQEAKEVRKAEAARAAEAARQAELARRVDVERAARAAREAAAREADAKAVAARQVAEPATGEQNGQSLDAANPSREEGIKASTSSWTIKRKVALGLGVGAVASLAVAVGHELRVGELQDEYDERDRELHESERDDLRPDLRRRATQAVRDARAVAIGFAVAGGALLGAAGYLWFTGGPARNDWSERNAASSRLAPVVTVEGASLFFSGSF